MHDKTIPRNSYDRLSVPKKSHLEHNIVMRGNNVLNILEEVSEYGAQKLIFSLTNRQAIGKEPIRGEHMPRGSGWMRACALHHVMVRGIERMAIVLDDNEWMDVVNPIGKAAETLRLERLLAFFFKVWLVYSR